MEKWTVARFRPAYQSDFRARMDWCVKSYARANHQPLVDLNGDSSGTVVTVSSQSGEEIILDAAGSQDPDGDHLAYSWHFYKEAGTFRGIFTRLSAAGPRVSLVAPAVTTRRTIHIILEVMDDGLPRLRSYRRIILIVDPATQ